MGAAGGGGEGAWAQLEEAACRIRGRAGDLVRRCAAALSEPLP